jgi:hypothetical protein
MRQPLMLASAWIALGRSGSGPVSVKSTRPTARPAPKPPVAARQDMASGRRADATTKARFRASESGHVPSLSGTARASSPPQLPHPALGLVGDPFAILDAPSRRSKRSNQSSIRTAVRRLLVSRRAPGFDRRRNWPCEPESDHSGPRHQTPSSATAPSSIRWALETDARTCSDGLGKVGVLSAKSVGSPASAHAQSLRTPINRHSTQGVSHLLDRLGVGGDRRAGSGRAHASRVSPGSLTRLVPHFSTTTSQARFGGDCAERGQGDKPEGRGQSDNQQRENVAKNARSRVSLGKGWEPVRQPSRRSPRHLPWSRVRCGRPAHQRPIGFARCRTARARAYRAPS